MPGDDDSIIIERKKDSMELIANLGAEWDRFIREAEKLVKYKHRQIVVCGPDNFETLIAQGFTQLPINFIYARMAFLFIKYQIPVIFMPDTAAAENYIFRLFHKVIQKTINEL